MKWLVQRMLDAEPSWPRSIEAWQHEALTQAHAPTCQGREHVLEVGWEHGAAAD
jgi:hypothetical protein